eukprot:TRINITY_DN1014_c0_g1_i1.p1 TRINITY_DN1014_c0_g1~~TRINITY_DN1014_c0_g1_i1.p1  ORF type:complete len:232 (+),score=52.65 TRINITY_DN1014_c0_g1_i1:211-906(+)
MSRLVLAIVLAVCVAGCTAATFGRGGCKPSSNFNWDYFLLMQQWPGTECNTSHCLPNADNYNYWTLHGLWPQRNDGSWPQCCPGPSYDPSRLSDLKDLLNQYWPSFEHGSDPNAFWSHEWEKHGTCAGTDHSCCSTEHDYFASALGLVKNFNIESALEAANIKYGSEYRTSAVQAALKSAFGVRPLVGCNRQYLFWTVGFCVDKNLKPFDCPPSNEECRAAEMFYPHPPRV